MTNREAIELQSGMNAQFGRWLFEYLKGQGNAIRNEAVTIIPATLAEQIEREQMFGASKKLLELVDQIPNTINNLVKTTRTEKD